MKKADTHHKKSAAKKSLTTVQKQYLCTLLTLQYLHSESFRTAFDTHYTLRKRSRIRGLSRHIARFDEATSHKLAAAFESHVFHRLAAVFALLGVIVLLQLLYPANRALPFSRLDAHGFIGFSSKDDILKQFQDFDTRTVTVHTHNKTITTSYRDLGVTLRGEQTVEQATSYPLKQKLIPFSIFFVNNQSFSPAKDLDESQLSLFVRDVVAQTDKPPIDAQITKNKTKLSVTPSEEGYAYKYSELKSQMLRSDLRNKAQIVFAPTVLMPKLTSDVANSAVRTMQARIDSPITIRAEDKTMTIDPETIASWVDVILKPEQNNVELVFNKERVSTSLRPFIAQVDYAPVNTVVTLLNGVQAGHVQGFVGKSLQFDDLVNKVSATTATATATIQASVLTVPPNDNINRTYSRDNAGLQNLLTYWTQNHNGEYSIDLRSVNGRLSAGLNPHRIFPSVGIYRIYIAHSIYGAISANRISGKTLTSAGPNVDECMDRMMRESDEGCSNALGTIVGWGTVDTLLRAQGFESTTLAQGAGITTANDASDWLTKLLEGSITTRSQANTLSSVMSGSSFRLGIPAGSDGIKVANKAGSYGRINHDVGIVYHPKGTYVLSVLSEGANSSLIADLTREINKVMNQ